MDQNHYEVLGVAQNATPKEIKAAYRSRMKESHTDSVLAIKAELEKKGVGAELIEGLVRPLLEKREEESKRLNLAYEILSDSKKRQQFDQDLKTSAPPILIVKPTAVNLGKLTIGTKKEVSFQIINQGGELTDNISISGWENLPWIQDKRIEMGEEDVFPIIVSFTIDTTSCQQKEDLSITISTTASSTSIKIGFEVYAVSAVSSKDKSTGSKPTSVPSPLVSAASKKRNSINLMGSIIIYSVAISFITAHNWGGIERAIGSVILFSILNLSVFGVTQLVAKRLAAKINKLKTYGRKISIWIPVTILVLAFIIAARSVSFEYQYLPLMLCMILTPFAIFLCRYFEVGGNNPMTTTIYFGGILAIFGLAAAMSSPYSLDMLPVTWIGVWVAAMSQ